jgi:hypothetical protein
MQALLCIFSISRNNMNSKNLEIQLKIHELYKEILGRHADPEGLSSATHNIMNGLLGFDDLKLSLMSSDEYRKKESYKELAKEYKDRVLEKAIQEIFIDPKNMQLF